LALLDGGSREECQEEFWLVGIESDDVADTFERPTKLLWTALVGGGADILLRGPGLERSIRESSLDTGGPSIATRNAFSGKTRVLEESKGSNLAVAPPRE
jgi:hypothetical protein